MKEQWWWREVEARWRTRVIAFGRRGFPSLCEEDLDDCFNLALVRLWKRDVDSAPSEVGGLLCLMMRSECRDWRAVEGAACRDVARTESLGRRVRIFGRRRPKARLYGEVFETAERQGGGDVELLDALEASACADDDAILAGVAERLGIAYQAAACRVMRLRKRIARELSEPWRGPDGQPVDGVVRARGRSAAVLSEFARRKAAASGG